MAQAEKSLAKQLEESQDVTIDDIHDVSTGKQYNMSLVFKVVETINDKPFFDSSVAWSGVQYAIVVATEAELVKLLDKFVELGGTVAQGDNGGPK